MQIDDHVRYQLTGGQIEMKIAGGITRSVAGITRSVAEMTKGRGVEETPVEMTGMRDQKLNTVKTGEMITDLVMRGRTGITGTLL